jgi:hypothetical protein
MGIGVMGIIRDMGDILPIVPLPLFLPLFDSKRNS